MILQLNNVVKRFRELILNELYTEGNVYCWVAGGAVRDVFMGLGIKTDVDLFFPNEEEHNKALTYFKEKGAEIIWESENGVKLKYENTTFDLTKKFFSSPQEAIENFDFTVSMFAVDINKVYYGETSFIDLSKRQLMLNKITYPASTLSRAFRYYKKGFMMCSGEMLKLCDTIKQMNEDGVLENPLQFSFEVDVEPKETNGNNATPEDLIEVLSFSPPKHRLRIFRGID